MNNSKNDELAGGNPNKRNQKYWAIGWTVIYLIFFPILFYAAILSVMVFDGPRITIPIGILIMFTWFWTPLSIPITIYLMWKSYFRLQYKQMRFYCALPVFTFNAFFIMNVIIDFFL